MFLSDNVVNVSIVYGFFEIITRLFHDSIVVACCSNIVTLMGVFFFAIKLFFMIDVYLFAYTNPLM